MEPKDPKFDFSTPRANVSENKGKWVELTPYSDSNKRKMSSLSNDSSSNKSSQGPSDLAVGRSKKTSFSCKFCPKTFLCPQALGGHQNGHKEERFLAKAEKKMRLGRYGYGPDGFYSHGNMRYFPYHQNALIRDFAPPFGWNGPRINPPEPEPTVVNSGAMLNVGCQSHGEEKGEEPLDLTLRL